MSQEKPEQAQELQTLVLGRTSEETLLLLTSRLSTCHNVNPIFAVFLFVHFFAHLFPLPSLCKIYIYTCSLSYLFLIKWSSPWIYLSACTLDFWHFACPPAWLSLPFCVCQPGFPTPSCLLTLSKGSSFIPIYSVVESCFWAVTLQYLKFSAEPLHTFKLFSAWCCCDLNECLHLSVGSFDSLVSLSEHTKWTTSPLCAQMTVKHAALQVQ